MSKQTATEWLFAHLLPFLNDNGFADPLENEHFFKCLAEAKAMEKEQIEDAFLESRLIHPMIGFKHEAFNDYFNETYGGDK